MKKVWGLAVLAAFGIGILCGAAILSSAAVERQTEQQGQILQVQPPEGDSLQLGQGREDWEFWGFQWQQYAFCYAVPPEWAVEQYGAWAKIANREDSPDWGVVLFTPDQQGQIQILGTARPQVLTVPGQQKSYQLSREGEIIGQAVFGSQQGQVSLMASFDQPGSAGASLFALVQMPETQWQQYQGQVLDILGEIYPAQPVQAAK